MLTKILLHCRLATALWVCWLVSAANVTGQNAAGQEAASQESSTGAASPQAQAPPPTDPVEFPDLTVPKNASQAQLDKLLTTAKAARPRNPQQYQAMQTAIRDAAKQLLVLLAKEPESARFKQAEMDAISSSVALMTYFGEDAKQKTLEQVHEFLKSRETLSLQDIQTGMMAGAMLELQPNKHPARDTYQLLSDLLEKDEREEMQSLRLNLQASIRRLDLLGNKFELEAEAMDGRAIKIDDLAGKFVIIDFFATWCEPCLSEIPRLQKHFAKYQAQGLEVIGISLDAESEGLEKYLARAQLPWPIIHDNHEDPLQRLQMKFGVSHLPTVLLLNKEGTVVSLEARGGELDRLMQMLFEAPTPAAPPPAPPGEPPVEKPAAQPASRLDKPAEKQP
jgi:peroxiredoxin